MADQYFTDKEKKSFKDIVLTHLSKILELGCKEFRGGFYQTIVHGDFIEKVYVPSTIKEFNQSIENFCYILLPHFDDEMEKDYEGIKKGMNAELEKSDKEFDNIQLKYMKELFKKLNLLLKRNDYLKSEVYGED